MHNDQNQYDFIMNPNQSPPAKRFRLPGGNSPLGRIAVFGGGLAILVIVISLFATLLTSRQDAAVNALADAAIKQNELIRVADIGADKARGQEAKNLAITTKLALQSQQKSMLSAVEKAGRKLDSKALATGKDAGIDEFLTTAEQNNVFDDAFIKVMNESLKDYQVAVEDAFTQVSTKSIKESLLSQYESANTLAGVAAEIEN